MGGLGVPVAVKEGGEGDVAVVAGDRDKGGSARGLLTRVQMGRGPPRYVHR